MNKWFKQHFNPLLVLVIPLALTGLLQSSTYFFETMFLAHLSQEALAAGALVSWLFGTFIVIVIGILSSINILVAHKHGAQDQLGISLIVRDGLLLALALIIPSFILFWNLSPIFLFLGQNPQIVKLAETYLHALSWSLFPTLLSFALLEFIVGLGAARILLMFSIINMMLTVWFSYLLIFGKYGFPALGIAGAGWGVTISSWILVCAVILFVLLNKKYRAYLHFSNPRKTPSYLPELFRVGLPMGLMYSVEVGFFFALTLVSGLISSDFLAANQIALQYMCILMSVVFSVAQAITVRMGHLLGAGEIESAKKASNAGVGLAMVTMMLLAIVFWLTPKQLIAIDFDLNNPANEDIIRLAVQLLAVSALFQIIEATRISLFGSLRALKDTRFTLFISILSFWGIALPVGYYLATKTHCGGVGLWWAMNLGALFSVILLYWRFRYKMKTDYSAKSP